MRVIVLGVVGTCISTDNRNFGESKLALQDVSIYHPSRPTAPSKRSSRALPRRQGELSRDARSLLTCDLESPRWARKRRDLPRIAE
ncbi:hypothetical protein P692DRAFT_2080045 [Suillus brevipes Sb2]|nr:hypothetical protein P692DRAFT_2080045 [Suillus brevipes Sb2]